MIAIRDELIDYMHAIPESRLEAIKPLLVMMFNDSISLERVSFHELDDEEKAAIIKGHEEYARGETTDFEDLLHEHDLTAATAG